MTVLRRGYVPVEPDTSKFDEKLREQFDRSQPGTKAGKQLGGQLNRALKRVNLDPIDIKADPKQALAQIELTERRLRGVADRAATIEIRVAAEKGLRELDRFKRQLGDVGKSGGDDAGSGFAASFGARIGPLLGRVAATPPVAAGGALIGAAMAPTLAAGIAGAVVGGAGIGGVVGGVVLAARDERVKAAGQDLGRTIVADLTAKATGFVPATLDGITRIRQGFAAIGPDLDKIFSSSRFVPVLADGAVKGAKGFIRGFADALDNADPVIDALGRMVSTLGTATGDLFRRLGEDAGAGASALDDLTTALATVISVTGDIIHAGAAVKGWVDQLDIAADKGRYWLEENGLIATQLQNIGIQLDLTADGFKAGTAEAESYRRASIGTADASDFARLAAAGMTEAQIAAADASGTYRQRLAEVKAEAEASARALGNLTATEDDVKDATKANTEAQQLFARALDQMGGAGGRAAQWVEGLKKATTNLYGAQEAGIDANEAYQASWDSLSEAVKRNKGSLDIHTAAGRANRDALQGLLTSSRDLYFADINAGVAIDTARRKHEQRTEAVEREAGKLGLNRKATSDLISTYGRIPAKRETDLVLEGVDKIVRTMMDLYVYQRSLAEGLPVASIRALLNNEKAGPAKRYGGYADGGWTGPGAVHEPAGVVHRDEFVVKKASRQRIERTNPGLLDELNATGQLPGYASGGWVGLAPVETRPFRIEVETGRTKIPSREAVAAKVAPEFRQDWPGSPGAQRGDSGVWRRVVQLIRSTGPLSGQFGNAYRPGDPLWHGSGRAVDWMGYEQDALASFLASKRPLELIHRTKTRDYAYTRGKNQGSFSESLMNAHRNHVHVAMDDGGMRVLQPGINIIPNGTGRPEPIAGPAAMATMGHTYNITVNVPVGAHPAETGRQVIETIQAYEARNGTRWRM